MSRPPDVLDLLAKARPARLEVPPHLAEHAAHAADRIVANAATADGHVRFDRHRSMRRGRVAAFWSVGVTAAAAATAVAVVVAGPGVAPRDSPPDGASDAIAPGAPEPADAGRLLLAAADRSDRAAPAGGRYRTLQTEHGSALAVETGDGTYTMIVKGGGQYWLARSTAEPSWAMSQSLGAMPATPTDEAAWRRHGSPSVIRVTQPKPAEVSIAPGRLLGNTVDPAHLFALGDRNVSQAQLDTLPTDPDALRTELLSRFDGGGSDMPIDRDQWLLTVATGLVIDLPVSNAVRAAAYRMIATMPGVRGLGAVHDMRGRPGQAVAFTQDSPAIGRFEVRLIINPDTGEALGMERRAVRPHGPQSWISPGSISSYVLVLVSTSTDDNPPTVDVTN